MASSYYIPGNLNNNFFMDFWWNTHFSCKDFVHHPTEASIYKWLAIWWTRYTSNSETLPPRYPVSELHKTVFRLRDPGRKPPVACAAALGVAGNDVKALEEFIGPSSIMFTRREAMREKWLFQPWRILHLYDGRNKRGKTYLTSKCVFPPPCLFLAHSLLCFLSFGGKVGFSLSNGLWVSSPLEAFPSF